MTATTTETKKTRDAAIAKFAAHAAALFAAKPSRQSVMIAVSQYWNDSADDEVSATFVVSARMTPVWPHECNYEYVEGDEWGGDNLSTLIGEECTSCSDAGIDMSFYGGYGDAMVCAFEPFCREGAHQGLDVGEAYIPFAIARRRGHGVDVELVAHAQRPPTVMIGRASLSELGEHGWPDDRARALFAEVCRHPSDNSPRAVLSDYLLERFPDDPRGEAIALALASELDDATRARRDALFAAYGDRWLLPIGDVIPAGTAYYERGFLARTDVYAASAADRDRVLGAHVWGTVHTIRFAPGSIDVISPLMTGLRDVGALRDDGLAAIVRADRTWAIERLRVDTASPAPLLGATNLPHLVQLDVTPAHRAAIVDGLRDPRWRALVGQLQRLVVVTPAYDAISDGGALRDRLGVPELAVAARDPATGRAAGWEIGFRADRVVVRSEAFHTETTMVRLAELVRQLPPDVPITLASTPLRLVAKDDVVYLREATGREVDVVP